MTSPSTSNGSTTEVNAKILENPTRTQGRSARSCYQSTQLSNVSDDKVRGAQSSTRGRNTAKSSRRRSKASKLDDVTIPALVRKPRRHNKKTHDSNTPTNPNFKLSNRTSKSSVTTSISGSSNLPTQSASSASSTSSSVGRVIQLAKEAADLDFECYGRRTTIMDLILDAKPPVEKYAEDVLMDAMDLGKKFNSSLPPPPPNHSFRKAKDLVGYWAQQESMWRGRQFGVYEDSTMDFSPRNIYNVSAERTTASWSSDKEEDREHGDIIGLLDSSTAATNSTGYLSSNATTTMMVPRLHG
ncbi:hypothetical protein C8Q75DRAFT_729763 [Abortiporus biennis]|nr:hypothetical protein C8Q75DRAFT_729763 [Abortiporus biennis]